MIALIVVAAACIVLVYGLRNAGPSRNRGAGPIAWRSGRRELTEEAARELVVRRLRGHE